jgi:hypothetical protein
MARVPITIMGFRCERCGYEWLPRRESTREPKVCPNPKCKSPYWNEPRKKGAPMLTYEDFRGRIEKVLRAAPADGVTWTEIRTTAALPQKFPNNQWVRQMEHDIKLQRRRDPHGVIRWSLG